MKAGVMTTKQIRFLMENGREHEVPREDLRVFKENQRARDLWRFKSGDWSFLGVNETMIDSQTLREHLLPIVFDRDYL